MIVDQLPQHRDEAIDGVGRLAVGSGQPADRVVRAIHLRAAVDQVQTRRRGHRAGKLQYIIRVMRLRLRAALLTALMAAATSGCNGRNSRPRPAVPVRRRSDAEPRRLGDAGGQRVDSRTGRAARFFRSTPIRARACRSARPACPRSLHLAVCGGHACRTMDAIGRRFVGVRLRIPKIRAVAESGGIFVGDLRSARR